MIRSEDSCSGRVGWLQMTSQPRWGKVWKQLRKGVFLLTSVYWRQWWRKVESSRPGRIKQAPSTSAAPEFSDSCSGSVIPGAVAPSRPMAVRYSGPPTTERSAAGRSVPSTWNTTEWSKYSPNKTRCPPIATPALIVPFCSMLWVPLPAGVSK